MSERRNMHLEELRKIVFEDDGTLLIEVFLRPARTDEEPEFLGCIGGTAPQRDAVEARHVRKRRSRARAPFRPGATASA